MNWPRRNRLDLNTPAELAIYNAMQEIEKMPADVKLTEAVILLSKAKILVSDFIDGNPNELEKFLLNAKNNGHTLDVISICKQFNVTESQVKEAVDKIYNNPYKNL